MWIFTKSALYLGKVRLLYNLSLSKCGLCKKTQLIVKGLKKIILYDIIMSHSNQAQDYIRKVHDAQRTDFLKLILEGPDNCGHNCKIVSEIRLPCEHFFQGLFTDIIYDENDKISDVEKIMVMAFQHSTTPEQHRKMTLYCNTATLKKGEREDGTIGTKGKGLKDFIWHVADQFTVYSENDDGLWVGREWRVKQQYDQAAVESLKKKVENQIGINRIGDGCTKTTDKACPFGKILPNGTFERKIIKKIRKEAELAELPSPKTFLLFKLTPDKIKEIEERKLEEVIQEEYKRKYCYNTFNIHYLTEEKDNHGEFTYTLKTLEKKDNILRNYLQDKITFYVKICDKIKYFFIEHNDSFKYFKFLNFDRDRPPDISPIRLEDLKEKDKNWKHGKDNCTFSITFGNVKKAIFEKDDKKGNQQAQGVYYFMKEHKEDNNFCALINHKPQSISDVFAGTGRHGGITKRVRVLIKIFDKANGWKIENIKVDTKLPQKWKKFCKTLWKYAGFHYKKIWAAELRDMERPPTVLSDKIYKILRDNKKEEKAAKRKRDNKKIIKNKINQKFYAQLFLKKIESTTVNKNDDEDDEDEDEEEEFKFTVKVGTTNRPSTRRQQENEKKCLTEYGKCEAKFTIPNLPTGCNLKFEELVKRFIQEVDNETMRTVVKDGQITDKGEIYHWKTWAQLNYACNCIKGELWNENGRWDEETFMKILKDTVVGVPDEDDLEEKVEN